VVIIIVCQLFIMYCAFYGPTLLTSLSTACRCAYIQVEVVMRLQTASVTNLWHCSDIFVTLAPLTNFEIYLLVGLHSIFTQIHLGVSLYI